MSSWLAFRFLADGSEVPPLTEIDLKMLFQAWWLSKCLAIAGMFTCNSISANSTLGSTFSEFREVFQAHDDILDTFDTINKVYMHAKKLRNKKNYYLFQNSFKIFD